MSDELTGGTPVLPSSFHMVDQLLHDIVDFHGIGLGAVVEEDTVTENGGGEGLDVFEFDVDAAFEEGAGLGPEDERLPGAGAGAPTDPIIDKLRGAGLARAGSGGEADGVGDEFLGDGDLLHQFMETLHIRAG